MPITAFGKIEKAPTSRAKGNWEMMTTAPNAVPRAQIAELARF